MILVIDVFFLLFVELKSDAEKINCNNMTVNSMIQCITSLIISYFSTQFPFCIISISGVAALAYCIQECDEHIV